MKNEPYSFPSLLETQWCEKCKENVLVYMLCVPEEPEKTKNPKGEVIIETTTSMFRTCSQCGEKLTTSLLLSTNMSEDELVYPLNLKAMAYDTEGKPMMCKKHGLPLGQMIMGKDAFMGWCAECEDGPSYKA